MLVATAPDAAANTSEFSASFSVTSGSPLMAAGGDRVDHSLREQQFVSRSKPTTLTLAKLQPIVDAAIARLASQGLTAAQVKQLSSVTFAIADLPGATLGLATCGFCRFNLGEVILGGETVAMTGSGFRS